VQANSVHSTRGRRRRPKKGDLDQEEGILSFSVGEKRRGGKADIDGVNLSAPSPGKGESTRGLRASAGVLSLN